MKEEVKRLNIIELSGIEAVVHSRTLGIDELNKT